MASAPTPRSYAKILGDMISTFTARYGATSIRPGSPILAILEAAAQSDSHNAQDVFAVLNANNLDRVVGDLLDREGAKDSVDRQNATLSTGFVTFSDVSFQKVFGTVSISSQAAYSTTLDVATASDWPVTGAVWVGRGSTTLEGPLTYSSFSQLSAGLIRFNLTTALSQAHIAGEVIVLAQGGDRAVSSGTIVSTAQTANVDSIDFSTTDNAIVLDGEVEVTLVPVRCQQTGTKGNVGSGAINTLKSPPFAGAVVTNPAAISNALDTESDINYRNRIKVARQSKSKGTIDAIQNAAYGKSASDESAVVSSTSILRRFNLPDILYIDDGTGYEEKSLGIGSEYLTLAKGGEQRFQLQEGRPVSKARLQTALKAPFTLSSGLTLSVTTGGLTGTHTFSADQYSNISSASAYEVVTDINANFGLPFSAQVADGGKAVVLISKSEYNNALQLNTSTANQFLGLTVTPTYDVWLYKNDHLLTQGSDYTLDRNLGQIELTAPLSAGDVLSAGSLYTNAYIQGPDTDLITASDGHLWVSVDGDSSIVYNVPVGYDVVVNAIENSVLIRVQLLGISQAVFGDLKAGDWLICTNPAVAVDLLTPSRIAYVSEDGKNVRLDKPFANTSTTYTPVSANEFVFVRTAAPIVALTIPTGSYTVTTLADYINSSDAVGQPRLPNATAYIADGLPASIRVATNSPVGDIGLLATDGVVIGFASTVASSTPSHFASIVAKNYDFTPTFFWDSVASQLNPVTVTLQGGPLTTDLNNEWKSQFGRPIPNLTGGALGAGLHFLRYDSETDLTNSIATKTPLTLRSNVHPTVDSGFQNGSKFFTGTTYNFGANDTLNLDINGVSYTLPFSIPAAGFQTAYLNTSRVALNATVGTDYSDFAVHMPYRCLLDSLSGVATLDATRPPVRYAAGLDGSYVYGTLSGATVAYLPPLNADDVVAVSATPGTRYDIQIRLAAGPSSGIVPTVGSEHYYAAVSNGPTADSSYLTFRYAFQMRTTTTATRDALGNVTVSFVLPAGFTANPWSIGQQATFTFNGGGFIDSVTPVTITGATSGATSTLTYNDGTVGVAIAGPINLPNAWISEGPVTGTPYNFSTISLTSNWVKVNTTLNPSFGIQLNDAYKPTSVGVGYFQVLVERVTAVQYATPTDVAPWVSGWFDAYATTSTPQSLAAAVNADALGAKLLVATSTANGVVLAYDTRHEWLLGYRTAPYEAMVDGINYVSSFTDPAPTFDHTDVTFKKAVSANLSGRDLWEGLPVLLVPTTISAVIQLLTKNSNKFSSLVQVSSTLNKLRLSSTSMGSNASLKINGGLANDAASELLDADLTNVHSIVSVANTPSAYANSILSFQLGIKPAKTSVSTAAVSITVNGDLVTIPNAIDSEDIVGARWLVEKTGNYVSWSSVNGTILADYLNGWVTTNSGQGAWNDVAYSTAPVSFIFGATTGAATVTLQDGRVLMCGGEEVGVTIAKARVWTENTGWVDVPDMSSVRKGHSATLLDDGTVLVVGGETNGGYTASCDIFNPNTNTWSATTALSATRAGHTATKMPDGKVVVIGGYNGAYFNTWAIYSAGAWTYDVLTLNITRSNHSATLISSTKIALVGGESGSALSSVEIFDYQNRFAYVVGALNVARTKHATVALPNGDVFVVGGSNGASSLSSAELFSFSTSISTLKKSMSVGRIWPAAVVKGTKVLVLGGTDVTPLSFHEQYDLATNTWSFLGSSFVAHSGYGSRESFAVLLNGNILFADTHTVTEQFDYTVNPTLGNYGTFQIASTQFAKNTFWIENPNATNEDIGVPIVTLHTYDSAVPGDTLEILDGVNVGSYTITKVVGSALVLDRPIVNSTARVLVFPGSYPKLHRKSMWVGSDPSDVTRLMIGLEGVQVCDRQILPQNKVTVNSISKLGFDTQVVVGNDSYRYSTGLIRELNKILYGDESDASTYPGIVAAGASINIEGPMIKRITVSLQVKIIPGTNVETSIQSAVTQVVNQTKMGENVAISDIISAANGVAGVVSVSVISPSYNSVNDEIKVQPYEKALVLSPANDVTVTVINA